MIQIKLVAQQDTSNLNSPKNILAFGDFLYCEKDYLRAVDEYKKYREFETNDSIQFRIANAYNYLQYYDKAETEVNKISLTSLKKNVFYFKMKNKFLQSDYSRLRTIYQNEELKSSASGMYYFSFLLDSSELPDEKSFLFAFDENIRPSMEKFYLRKLHPHYKSPVVAGIFSALIPGAGKIYTGNIGDGITATLLTGLLSFISYDSFRANHNFKGWLFVGIGAFFYAGNIYGSVAAAQIYNDEQRTLLKNELHNFIKANNFFLPDYELYCN